MSSPEADAAVNDDAALRMLAGYYSAFTSLEVQAVLPYFHEPCGSRNSDEKVKSAPFPRVRTSSPVLIRVQWNGRTRSSKQFRHFWNAS
jgi:hypothetical protein